MARQVENPDPYIKKDLEGRHVKPTFHSKFEDYARGFSNSNMKR